MYFVSVMCYLFDYFLFFPSLSLASCLAHSIMANRSGNTVLFHEDGGMDVGDIDSKARRMEVDIDDTLTTEQAHVLVSGVAPEKQE